MKSTVEQSKTGEEIIFPILMEWIPDQYSSKDVLLVVSFNSYTSGTVVGVQNTTRKIGEYSTTFANAKDSTKWKKFKGKIILENS